MALAPLSRCSCINARARCRALMMSWASSNSSARPRFSAQPRKAPGSCSSSPFVVPASIAMMAGSGHSAPAARPVLSQHARPTGFTVSSKASACCASAPRRATAPRSSNPAAASSRSRARWLAAAASARRASASFTACSSLDFIANTRSVFLRRAAARPAFSSASLRSRASFSRRRARSRLSSAKPSESGLVRPSPAPAETVGEDGAPLPRPIKSATTQRYKRATVKERKEQREETRLETRTSDGQVISSDVKRRECVEERIATNDLETDDRRIQDLRRGEEREDGGRERAAQDVEHEPEEPDGQDGENAVAKRLALDEREWNDEHGRDEFVIPFVHRGSGRTYKSFGDMLEDPAAPMSPFTKTWEVSACSPEEIVKSYGAVATLALKIPRVAVEHRQEAASACWHALQCINHIYARLGDIVDSVWIEQDRFVIIHIKDSEELKATGRVVIGPSGGYAYCFKGSKSENLGHSEGNLGQLFFPLGNDVETFESFGWPGKPEDTWLDEDEKRDL